ncbi:hypothetical protein PUN28_004607 [Cardiocondyla obscurior]|uniref:Uncharacterized protein n=1 Tax=Cardiocondyla obscurior TaxID=286306 RepID=A0AAW2GGC8_9HYME
MCGKCVNVLYTRIRVRSAGRLQFFTADFEHPRINDFPAACLSTRRDSIRDSLTFCRIRPRDGDRFPRSDLVSEGPANIFPISPAVVRSLIKSNFPFPSNEIEIKNILFSQIGTPCFTACNLISREPSLGNALFRATITTTNLRLAANCIWQAEGHQPRGIQHTSDAVPVAIFPHYGEYEKQIAA